MSSRLAFQTQLASIMEVLANAAVAEICKLVDDDYAVVSLQMSQCQRENKALKRKLHLLELKMARGNAERRLRESALNGGRARVQLNDRLRLSSPSAEAAEFDQHVDVTLWHGRLEDSTNKPVHPDSLQSKSPDVELVQPEVMLVKEEKVEDNIPQLEGMDGDSPLIRSDGVVDRVHRGTAGNQATLKELNNQCHFSSRSSGVEEEEEPDVVLVKVEEGDQGLKLQNPTCLSIQEGLVESSTGNQIQEPNHGFSESRGLPSTPGLSGESSRFKPGTRSSSGPHEQQPPAPRTDYSVFELETILTHWAPDDHPSPSCSFATQTEGVQEDVIIVTSETASGCAQVGPPVASSVPARPLTNTSLPQWAGTLPLKNRRSQLHHPSFSKSAMGGSTALTADSSSSTSSTAPSQYPVSVQGPASGLPRQLHGGLAPRHCKLRTAHRRKGFVCRVCGKAFPGQSNLEAHERVHTGERPFHCDTCGKQFSEAGNLKKHQRVHTGEKPFRCENCGKRFAWICNLRTHQLSATCCGPQIQGGLS